jgi:hypothetical protein
MNLFGFGLLRNGVKYDYCFQESLQSLSDIVEEVYLALGDSDDGTEEKLNFLKNLKILPTVWNLENREGGIILSEQTNIALDSLRKDHHGEQDWGIYLQCDEVFHESDYDLVKRDIQKAQETGCDVVAFRYLHFWQSHHKIAINKKWYPQEIRAVKLDSKIESWGDAQSFRHYEKVYYSEARIFHYGHVREEDKYKDKKESILKLYHSDKKLPKYQRREKRFDNQTETLNFWGLHPAVMKNRIERLGEKWLPEKKEKVYIVGKKEEIDIDIPFKIYADHLVWVKSIFEVPKNDRRTNAVILKPDLITKFIYPSNIPDAMRSKLAKPWNLRFKSLLKFYEKDIGVEV